MCGIAGFVSKESNSLSVSVIADLTRLIEHRGPDDEGFMCLMRDNRLISAGGNRTDPDVWVTPTEYRPVIHINEIYGLQAVMALGHRRLSILDLTPSGHQPMSFKNGRYWIVFNGEIYNYLELKTELEKCGNQFKTNSDTETILAAYSEWGESCLDRLVGMWSFAIFDRDKNEVFLARDRYGIKPLYYYFSPKGDFFFASEIKQFTVITGWRSKINPQRAYDQLVYSFTDHTDETMFAGVFQIPGGCFFKSTLNSIKAEHNGKIKFTHWYQIKREPFKGSFTDATGAFKALFERSVKEHLHADVPVGTALSGGLDSSSIVCEVNRILHAQSNELLQKTFSSCSTYERFSEKKWMDIVINHTKVNAFFVFPRLEEVMAITPDILWHHDEPYQSQSAFLAYNLFKLAQTNDVKVLLNGQGADEYLGGYGQFTIARYAEMVREFRILSMLNDLTKSQKINNLSKVKLFSDIAKHLLPTTLKRIFSKARSSSDRVKRIIDLKKLGITSLHPYDSIPVFYGTVPEISEHLTFFSTLPKYLHWEDRNSMAHSVEARVPFLDHRLVEFAYNLPDTFLDKEGINKRVMREAMEGLLPESIKNRKDKMGFSTPEEMWVKRENPVLFRNLLSEAVVISTGIIKPEALEYFDDVVNEKVPFDYTYWRLILFSEWIKKFDIEI